MGRRISILSIVIPTFGAAAAAAAIAALIQLAPGSGAPQIFPLSQPHMARAGLLLGGPRERDPKALAEAETEAREALKASPARADAWLALAYVEQVKAGRFGPKASVAVGRSYLVGPLDPDVSLWRLQFCFDNWTALPQDLKADALRELAAMWSRNERREALRSLQGQIADPAGRLAFRVQVALADQAERQAAATDD